MKPWPRLLTGAAAVGALFLPVAFLAARMLSDVGSGCSGGLDGLGCALMARLVVWAGVNLVMAVVGGVLLAVLRVRRGFLVGVLGGLAMFGAWPLFRSAGMPWTVLVVVVVHVLVFGALFGVLTAPLPGPVRVPVAVLAAFAVGFVLMPVGSSVDSALFRHEQEDRTRELPFTPYLPGSVPAGFRLYDAQPSPAIPGLRDPAHYRATWIHGRNDAGDPGPFVIDQWRTGATPFAPPADCGPAYPSVPATGDPPLPPVPCERAGSMPDGTPIWFVPAAATVSSDDLLLVDVGTTHLVLSWSTTGSIGRPAAVTLLRSLRPRQDGEGG